MTTVAVIIPYFQEKPGILRRALDSVLAQNLPSDVRVDVIVVDDGSPVPARMEIEGLDFVSPYRLTLIEQPNGGVAAARNAGLNNASDAITYIAFLDSDDIWDPEHLSTALSALDSGFDYYFCDNRRIGHHDSLLLKIADDKLLSITNGRIADQEVYEINKDVFFKFFLRTFTSQISTVVYRRSIAPALTFNTSLRISGEDYLFLLQIVMKCNRVCYSPEIRVTCGKGINIYFSKFSWDNPGHLLRYMAHILELNAFRKNLPLSSDDKRDIVGKIRISRKAFAFLSTRYFLKKRKLWPTDLVEMTRLDPRFLFWYPAYVLYVAFCYPLRLYSLPLSE